MTAVMASPDPDTAAPPPAPRWQTSLKQVGIVLLGLALAAAMVGLGLWQLGVYNAQGQQQAQARAAAPPVALESVARPGQQVGDGYARQVRFTGEYLPQRQLLIPFGSGDRYRVLTALRLSTGGTLPVVRGVVTGHHAPAPPEGTVTQTGILMPSEGSDSDARPGAEPTSVVLPSLAQRWSGPLVNGFATLNAAEAREQTLQPAAVELPNAHGRLRNGFYALQWWVFAGFAVWMAVRMARDFGHTAGGVMGSGGGPDATSTIEPAPDEAEGRSQAGPRT